MEPSDNAGDKVTSKSSFFNGTTILALLIIVVQILVSAGTYPFLPPMVPSHFDASGQVNGYLPKLVNAILLPGISLMLFLILRFATQVGPNLGYRNQRRANTQVVNLILVGILLFMLVIQLLTDFLPNAAPCFRLGFDRFGIDHLFNHRKILRQARLALAYDRLFRRCWNRLFVRERQF